MSKRKGPEMPTFFAYSRNEKSALSRSLAQRRFDHVSANEACGSVARREQPGKALLGKKRTGNPREAGRRVGGIDF